MPYTPIVFEDLPSTATPVTADTLAHMQTQYAQAVADAGGSQAGLPLAFDGDLSTWTAPAGEQLTIPTFDSSGQATHPSVVFVPDGWNGYEYWMAFTPYPSGNDDYEDPSIVASRDGITWVVPDGLTNPIDDADGSPEYNSDTDLILGDDGQLHMFWRFDDSAATGAEDSFYVSSSADGVTWSAKRLVWQADQSVTRLVSPAFIIEDGGLTMWAVDIVPSPNELVRLRAEGVTPATVEPDDWGTAGECTISFMESGKEPWHVEARKIGGTYVALLNNCTLDANGSAGGLFLMTSPDGVTWESAEQLLLPRTSGTDYDALYRGTFIPEVKDGVFGLRIWFGAWWTATTTWHIYRTFASAPAATLGLGGWVTYTPTLTNVTGGPAVTARYIQLGKLVHVEIEISLNGTNITGTVQASLPVAAVTTLGVLTGSCKMRDDSAGTTRTGVCQLSSSIVTPISNPSGSAASVNATTPFTWAASDYLLMAFSYLAA